MGVGADRVLNVRLPVGRGLAGYVVASGQALAVADVRSDRRFDVETAESTGSRVAGPVPLPTRIEKFCVIRSPFIDKDSQEQFEIRTHKRLIDVLEPNQKTISALMRLNLPAGVDIEIKL